MITIKILKTGETCEVDALWGLRLIEQGKAVAAKRKPAKKEKKHDGAEGQDPI